MFSDPCGQGIARLNCTTTTVDAFLKKGVETSIFSLVTNGQQLISSWSRRQIIASSTSASQNEKLAREALLQSIYMSQSEYIFQNAAVILDWLIQQYKDAVKSYDTFGLLINIVIIVFCIIIGLSVFFLLWIPYVNNMNATMRRVRGMLNMIPMNVISKNEILKKELTDGELLKAVR